jgi:ATP/maltotriose-dependent transcriptional regulator MalT
VGVTVTTRTPFLLEPRIDRFTCPHDALSARELECLRWVAAGKTDREIGMILSISATTAKFHVNRAREARRTHACPGGRPPGAGRFVLADT